MFYRKRCFIIDRPKKPEAAFSLIFRATRIINTVKKLHTRKEFTVDKTALSAKNLTAFALLVVAIMFLSLITSSFTSNRAGISSEPEKIIATPWAAPSLSNENADVAVSAINQKPVGDVYLRHMLAAIAEEAQANETRPEIESLVEAIEATEIVASDAISASDAQHSNLEPIYEVYKNGVRVEVPGWLQWLIRDLAVEHNYPENIIYGMILKESTFDSNANNSNLWLGLAQITPYWISELASTNGLAPYRLTEDYRERDLFDSEHNLLTLMEIWNYARDFYKLNPWDDEGMARLLYWHNVGRENPNNVSLYEVMNREYTVDIFGFASELVLLTQTTPRALLADLGAERLTH